MLLLAIGFVHPEPTGILGQLGLDLTKSGNIKTSGFQTSRQGVFAAGDARRGQSLVVWAIAEGRKAAQAADRFLME